jgi:transaldolase
MSKIQIYLDTADISQIIKTSKNNDIKGYTTNPSLMNKNKIKSYKKFIEYLSSKISKPISFEIFADNESEIYRQALTIANFSKNIFVKVPIVNSKGKSLCRVIKKLSNKKIKLNITAVFTPKQFKEAYLSLDKNTLSIISIFAGRIADTGRDPKKTIEKCVRIRKNKKIKILWASTREYFNITQAQDSKCDIITVTPEIYNKKIYKNYNLKKFSTETSKMFYEDAKKLKLSI